MSYLNLKRSELNMHTAFALLLHHTKTKKKPHQCRSITSRIWMWRVFWTLCFAFGRTYLLCSNMPITHLLTNREWNNWTQSFFQKRSLYWMFLGWPNASCWRKINKTWFPKHFEDHQIKIQEVIKNVDKTVTENAVKRTSGFTCWFNVLTQHFRD